jgi:hypothetical protein
MGIEPYDQLGRHIAAGLRSAELGSSSLRDGHG